MLRGTAQNLGSHGSAAGEEDEVEFLGQQRLIFGTAAGDEGHMAGVEDLLENGAQNFAAGGRVGAGL